MVIVVVIVVWRRIKFENAEAVMSRIVCMQSGGSLKEKDQIHLVYRRRRDIIVVAS